MKVGFYFFIIFVSLISCQDNKFNPEDKPHEIQQLVQEEVVATNPDTIIIGGNETNEESKTIIVDTRDILLIELRANDELVVEGKSVSQDELKTKIRFFYQANSKKEIIAEMPVYIEIGGASLDSKISSLKPLAENASEDSKLRIELKNLELKRKICGLFSTNSFREISNSATIEIHVFPYIIADFYQEIRSIVTEEVEKLRAEKRKEINWGNSKITESEKQAILELLVPERVVEIKSE